MARLSFLEHHTLQPGGQGQAKPLCLRNPDYAKMRKKIELSFPDQLETAKVNEQAKEKNERTTTIQKSPTDNRQDQTSTVVGYIQDC